MDQITGSELLNSLHEASFVVDKALVDLQGTCPEEQFRACANLLGSVMAEMFETVMAPIYDQHVDLAPDWYRGGPPAGGPDIPKIEAPPEVRRALLVAFDDAYEKVQSTLARVSRLSDPVEAALFSMGVHYVSVTLCRARVALLLAKTE